jgi:hypothetical protein
MVGFCPEEEILFSNDAFGQHLASSERFDDEFPLDIIFEEAQKYYANIVMPYGLQVQKALEDIRARAVSHNVSQHICSGQMCHRSDKKPGETKAIAVSHKCFTTCASELRKNLSKQLESAGKSGNTGGNKVVRR